MGYRPAINIRSRLQQLNLKADEVLLPEPDDIGLILAYLVWGLWFVCLCFMALMACMTCEIMGDLAFAQGTGIASAFAILFTIRPTPRSQRLHAIMLTLCIIVYFGLQRPMAYTPHGTFLRAFHCIKKEMTVAQVKSLMLPYRDQYYSYAVDNELPPRWWLNNKYSGEIRFNHTGPDSVDGFYHVTFTNGRVTKILFYDD